MSLSGLPPRHTSSPMHWLDRAKKARNAAKTMGDLSLRILEVAVGYERLAKRAEKQMLNLKADQRPRD